MVIGKPTRTLRLMHRRSKEDDSLPSNLAYVLQIYCPIKSRTPAAIPSVATAQSSSGRDWIDLCVIPAYTRRPSTVLALVGLAPGTHCAVQIDRYRPHIIVHMLRWALHLRFTLCCESGLGRCD